MNITHRLISAEEQMKVIAWHEDATRAGNYVLTLETAIERADLKWIEAKHMPYLPMGHFVLSEHC